MRWSTRGGWSWGAVASVTGCLGCANPLPVLLDGSSDSGEEATGASSSDATTLNAPTADASTSDAGTTEASTTDATTSSATIVDSTTSDTSATSDPLAECGNGAAEDGEECDGTDLNGATCESLGQAPGALGCTAGCIFDVTSCVPHGMVLVPGGVFEMGSNDSPDEMPIRQVQVDTFWMDETEVTVEAYTACVDDGACPEPGMDPYCNWMVAGREDHPVNCVTWYQAEQYCGWAGGGTKRLPTEAEWEKAARGTDAREYPWGNRPTPTCIHVVMFDAAAGCGMDSTWPVGSKPLGDSPYGAHDMAGNVWEWVADWYASSYDPAETDNPTGPETGSQHVARGGAWSSFVTVFFRTTFRFTYNPAASAGDVGFRCARTPSAPP